MKTFTLGTSFLILVVIALVTYYQEAEAQVCRPSGNIRGRKPPPGECNQENDSDCCVEGKLYPVYRCSPTVSGNTKAVLTLNSFQAGGDGGGPSECDNQYHSDDTPVVAHYQPDGMAKEEGVSTTSSLVLMGRALELRLWMSDSTMGCDGTWMTLSAPM
ncbi:hypothetical protein Acr_00g0028870 [Actinidia rufa]|uniref:Uncharacterized protein n=1 Tax=Actinidia rufa TaxID=165716 RepID=A0A7J0DEZ3_9ERIC|nr:hypothetical protein Acr_00g0028870 [Actinidia rufa]